MFTPFPFYFDFIISNPSIVYNLLSSIFIVFKKEKNAIA